MAAQLPSGVGCPADVERLPLPPVLGAPSLGSLFPCLHGAQSHARSSSSFSQPGRGGPCPCSFFLLTPGSSSSPWCSAPPPPQQQITDALSPMVASLVISPPAGRGEPPCSPTLSAGHGAPLQSSPHYLPPSPLLSAPTLALPWKPAAMASPFPSFLAEQRGPSVDEARCPFQLLHCSRHADASLCSYLSMAPSSSPLPVHGRQPLLLFAEPSSSSLPWWMLGARAPFPPACVLLRSAPLTLAMCSTKCAASRARQQPIRDAVKTLGEKPPLFSMFIFRCV
jgi:hypothetical protein